MLWWEDVFGWNGLFRPGDAAELAVIELVDKAAAKGETKEAPAKKAAPKKAAAAKKPGKIGQRARLAETLKGMKK